MAYDTASYEVLSKDGNMEIRKYPAQKWVGNSDQVCPSKYTFY